MIMPTRPGIELTPALAAKLPRRKVPWMPRRWEGDGGGIAGEAAAKW